MSLKRVFCNIGNGDERRCKIIKYTKQEGQSDVSCINASFMNCVKKDIALQTVVQNKILIFQQENPIIKQFCDLESDDEVESDSIINLVLVPNFKKEPLSSDVTNTVVSDLLLNTIDIRDLQVIQMKNESLTPSQKVTVENIGQVAALNTVEKTVENSGPASTLITEEKTVENSGQALTLNSVEKSVEKSGQASTSKTVEKKNNSTTSKNNSRRSVGYPARLPLLTEVLQKIKDQDEVYEKQSEFILFWSTHLESITDGNPTKTDYFNYCKTIVETFPELKDGSANVFNVIKTQISTSIRNRRYYQKQLIKKSTTPLKTNSSIILSTAKKSGTQQSIEQPTGLSSEKDIKEAEEALQKCTSSDESLHVKRLLQETYTVRRLWIEKDAKNIKEIVEKYPQLKVHTLIMQEFCQMKEKNEAFLYDLMDKLIIKLGKYFDMSITDENSKVEILKSVYEKLTLAKYRKVNEPLFTIEEAGKSTSALLTSETTAPRIVFYSAEGGIAEAFIVSNGARIKIRQPNVSRATVCLLAAYYVWHCSYPTAYCNMFQYFDLEVLEKQEKNNRILKFIRDMEHKNKANAEVNQTTKEK